MKLAKLFLLCFILSLFSCYNSQKQLDTSTEKGLKDYANFPIGNAVSINKLLKDKELLSINLQEFNSFTSSSDMKMYSFLKSEGEYNWENADQLLDFCEKNNKRFFGHNLVWHFAAPQWIVDNAQEKGYDWLDAFLKDYISTVVSRYKGKVAAWDVVNEGFATKGGEYRNSFFYETMGKDYIAKAFEYAHAADPEAILFYNDFNIERDTAKLHGVLNMINELKANNVPIGGLGFQMHIRMDTPDSTIAYALKKGAETGLQIHLSELDIIFNRHDDTQGGGEQLIWELSDEMKQAQAEKYKNLVKMYRQIIPKKQQYGITFWGCNDRDTWINGFFNLKDWPTIFDENLEPKAAYFGFTEGLNE